LGSGASTAGRRPAATHVVRLACAATLTLAGCTVGDDYAAPDVSLPTDWTGIVGDPNTATVDADLTTWWQALDDPTLDQLIVLALQNNLDLREAAERITEARFIRARQAGELLPQVDGTADYTHSRQSENLGGFSGLSTGGEGGESTGGGGFSPDSDLYQLGGSVSWELDVFGRLRRRVEAADARLELAVEDARAVQVALVADVGLAYLDAREFQSRILIARRNAEQQQRALDLAEARFQNGLTVELDVAEARANLRTTLATIPALRLDLQIARNRLATLLAVAPGAADDLIGEYESIPTTAGELAIGIPADLLRRRPDIRRAEREVAAATADIGAARADLYPRFSLIGSFGFAADDVGELFEWDSRTYAIGPSLQWPIWQGGSLRAQIQIESAQQRQALLAYERQVLEALAEVADALSGLAQQRDRLAELDLAAESANRAVELAEARYQQGLIEFDRVLLAQRTLLTVEDERALAAADVTENVINLYRALGGGWAVPVTPQVAATP
jgi:NodT family efflux transporter outer membrane factor (OMF) lipoprotein